MCLQGCVCVLGGWWWYHSPHKLCLRESSGPLLASAVLVHSFPFRWKRFFSCAATILIGVCFGVFFVEFVVVVFIHWFLLLLLESAAQSSEFLLQRPWECLTIVKWLAGNSHGGWTSDGLGALLCRLSKAFVKQRLKAPGVKKRRSEIRNGWTGEDFHSPSRVPRQRSRAVGGASPCCSTGPLVTCHPCVNRKQMKDSHSHCRKMQHLLLLPGPQRIFLPKLLHLTLLIYTSIFTTSCSIFPCFFLTSKVSKSTPQLQIIYIYIFTHQESLEENG